MSMATQANPSSHTFARAYARRNWRIAPIPQGSKHPRLNDWVGAATTDAELIDQWYDTHSDDGVGIVTGKASGLLVVDVDTSDGKRGEESLLDLQATYGKLPDTAEVVTGSGGRHLYYRIGPDAQHITSSAGRLGPGIDIRCEGGQVVAPPSIHPVSGRRYEWEASSHPDNIVDAPDWLLEVLTTPADAGDMGSREPRQRLDGKPTPGDLFDAFADPAKVVLELAGGHYIGKRVDWEERLPYHLIGRPAKPGEANYEPHPSATWDYKGGGVLKVFTDGWRGVTVDGEVWRLESEQTYSPFGLLALIHHAGNYSAAAKAIKAGRHAELLVDGWQDLAPGITDDAPDAPDAPDDLADVHDTPEEPQPSSWLPVDLTDALAGIDVPPPTMWRRSDNVPLIYEGRVHWLQGPPESMKSMAGQLIVAEELALGHDVLYIDFEDDDRGVVARMLSMGATPDDISAHLTYVRPDEALQTGDGRWTAGGIDYMALVGRKWSLVLVDGVTEAMTLEGMELLDNTDNAKWMRLIPKRLASTGAAVVVIDHTVKNAENAGRYAIGGQHKLAGVTGATYRFEIIRPLARAVDDPITGQAKVVVTKDRPGWVRGRCQEGVVGMFEVTSYPDGGISAQMMAPGAEANAVDMELVGHVLMHLATYDGATGRQMEEHLDVRGSRTRAAIKAAIGRGWVTVSKVGASHQHHLTATGREVMK